MLSDRHRTSPTRGKAPGSHDKPESWSSFMSSTRAMDVLGLASFKGTNVLSALQEPPDSFSFSLALIACVHLQRGRPWGSLEERWGCQQDEGWGPTGHFEGRQLTGRQQVTGEQQGPRLRGAEAMEPRGLRHRPALGSGQVWQRVPCPGEEGEASRQVLALSQSSFSQAANHGLNAIAEQWLCCLLV